MDALFVALILGILEGATEFLPISSTGHLILAQAALGMNDDADKTFAIAIQLGAILAVVWFYRQRLWHLMQRWQSPETRLFVLNLFIAFLPSAIVGLWLGKTIKAHLFHPAVVAAALFVGGLAILWLERRYERTGHHIDSVEDISPWLALKIGCAQCLALIPGTSRSGATIMGGLYLGLSRKAAAEFSFFLAIPTMLAATLYTLAKDWHTLSLQQLHAIGVGFVAAFVSGFVAVRWLLGYVSRHTYRVFAWYRMGLAWIIFLFLLWTME